MIYYLYPYTELPIGGILKIFDHVEILNQNNIPAKTVFFDEIKWNWRRSKILFVEKNKTCPKLWWTNTSEISIPLSELLLNIKKDDVVVIPEIRPFLINLFPEIKIKKVCFVQNWHEIKPRTMGLKGNQTYADLGFNFLLTCGNFLEDYVQGNIKDYKGGNHKAGPIQVFAINNSINQSVFYRDDKVRQHNRIIMLERKGKEFIEQIIKKIKNLSYEIYIVDRPVTQHEFAEELRKSDIYIHTGLQEGFALPPLEAMKSGCVVIGFSGGGGLEFMRDQQTALLSREGDTDSIVKNLEILLHNEKQKEFLRESGYQISLSYTKQNEEKKLLAAYYQILS